MKSFFAFTLASLLVSSALAITITSPSASQYWVLNSTNNVLSWTSSAGDPPVFSVILTPPPGQNDTFNGALAILNNVPTTNSSVTIPRVNLPTGNGFVVQFINITNIDQVYASSPSFPINAAGTPPPSPSTSPSSSASGSGSSASKTASSSNPSSSSSNSDNASNNGNNNSSGAMALVVGSNGMVTTMTTVLVGVVVAAVAGSW